MIINSEGVITVANAASADMFGRSRDELAGLPLTALMPARYRTDHSIALRRVNNGRGPKLLGTLVETEGLRADGTSFPLEFRPSLIAGDGPATYVATMRDITVRKKTQEELQKHRDQLEDLVVERTAKMQANSVSNNLQPMDQPLSRDGIRQPAFAHDHEGVRISRTVATEKGGEGGDRTAGVRSSFPVSASP